MLRQIWGGGCGDQSANPFMTSLVTWLFRAKHEMQAQHQVLSVLTLSSCCRFARACSRPFVPDTRDLHDEAPVTQVGHFGPVRVGPPGGTCSRPVRYTSRLGTIT